MDAEVDMCTDAARRWAPLLVAGVMIAGSTPGAASRPTDDSVFRGGVELVALNVIVTDPSRRFVSDLQEHDFEVLEDGVPQPIAFFARGQVPLDVVLLIDTSSSMGTLRPTVQRAARGFLKVLKPGDRGAVVGFSQRLALLQDLTGDVESLESAVRRAGALGETALYSSLYVALREFGGPARQTTEVRRKAIVLLTDGEENQSSLEFDVLEAEAQSRGVAVYAIMLQQDSLRESERIAGRLTPARDAIRRLAVETGALAYFPDRAEQLAGVYERIAAELSNQYSLAYLPKADGGDRRVRRVAVRVASRPALTARSRTSYLPGKR
jgi:Ca-activated chloride channel homolog